MEIRSKIEKQRIFFNGKRYTRHINAKRIDHRKYFVRHERVNKKLITLYLHRDIWIYTYGDIPKGMIVHHKDNNQLNNDIKNLELLTASEHAKEHVKEKLIAMHNGFRRPEIRKQTSIRVTNYWKNKPTTDFKCSMCGVLFKAKVKRSHCNKKCYDKTYRLKKDLNNGG